MYNYVCISRIDCKIELLASLPKYTIVVPHTLTAKFIWSILKQNLTAIAENFTLSLQLPRVFLPEPARDGESEERGPVCDNHRQRSRG